jgi:hypothetical protein
LGTFCQPNPGKKALKFNLKKIVPNWICQIESLSLEVLKGVGRESQK